VGWKGLPKRGPFKIAEEKRGSTVDHLLKQGNIEVSKTLTIEDRGGGSKGKGLDEALYSEKDLRKKMVPWGKRANNPDDLETRFHGGRRTRGLAEWVKKDLKVSKRSPRSKEKSARLLRKRKCILRGKEGPISGRKEESVR